MLVLQSLVKGVSKAGANKFLIVMMYLFKLVCALVLLFPLYLMFSTSFGRNVKALNFLTRLDLSLIIDFVYHWRETLSIYLLVLIFACGMVILVFIFLSGGFWGILRDDVRNGAQNRRMERFFGYCGGYFWGMFKIALFLGFCYFIAFILFLFLSAVFNHLAGKADVWEVTSWRILTKFLIGVILFLLVNMMGDYLRIFLIENRDERFPFVVRKTFKFLLTNPLRTLSLYYLLSVLLTAAILIFLGFCKAMNTLPQTGLFIFFAFLIQQAFVVFKSFFRLAYYSSQLVLYDRISRDEKV
jgi:hypothetical protein